MVNAVEDAYNWLRRDLVRAGYFLNKENIEILAEAKKPWKRIEEDVLVAESFLGEEPWPVEEEHFIYRNISSNTRILLSKGAGVSEEIARSG